MRLEGGVSYKFALNTRKEFHTRFAKKTREGGVLKLHIYLWKINTEYSCRETFFEVYTKWGEFHAKFAKKSKGRSRKTRGGSLEDIKLLVRVSYIIRNKKHGGYQKNRRYRVFIGP